MLQNANPLRKSAPSPPNIMSLVLRLPRKMYLRRSSSNVPRLPSFLEMPQNPHACSLLTRCTIPCACHAKRRFNVQKWRKHVVFRAFWLRNMLRATTACTFSTSQLPTVLQTRQFFALLTSKCASRHKSVRFFQHLNFQQCSEHGVFCTFWLRNVLRATRACNFSSRIWPAGSAPAALASLLFDPPEPQIIGKTQCFRDFPTFSRTWIFFLWRLSLFDLLSSFLLFSDSSHLCFSSVHVVGNLTSKLPSIRLFSRMAAPSPPSLGTFQCYPTGVLCDALNNLQLHLRPLNGMWRTDENRWKIEHDRTIDVECGYHVDIMWISCG